MRHITIAAVIIAVAVFSFWTGGRLGSKRSHDPLSDGSRDILYFVDPMNPGFKSDKPGIAPCGMPLEPVYGEITAVPGGKAKEDLSARPDAVRVTSARQQQIGMKVGEATNKSFTYFVRLFGRVVPDETLVHVINASTDCWIREISEVTTGSIVRKDQILGEALAPAYYNAQVTYLVALNNIDRIREQLGGETRHQQGELADNTIRVAVQALQNLGITDAQTAELAKTRQARPYLQIRSPCKGVVLSRRLTLNQWLKAADEFFTVADIGRVWVYADIYEDEANYLRPGMPVNVDHAQIRKFFDARVGKVLPLFDAVAKTLKVRLDVENPTYDLRPDMFVDVKIPITLPPSINLPADAVINSGTRTVVYVDLGDGLFAPRRVKTGWRLGRRVEITEGLTAGERVVVSGNFLIDSESRMKTAGADVSMDDSAATAASNSDTPVDAAISVGDEPNWAKMLAPGTERNLSKKANKSSAGGTEKTKGKYPTSPSVIDWNGPDKEGASDWGKWGAFPGAKYLGIGAEKKNFTSKKRIDAVSPSTTTPPQQNEP